MYLLICDVYLFSFAKFSIFVMSLRINIYSRRSYLAEDYAWMLFSPERGEMPLYVALIHWRL